MRTWILLSCLVTSTAAIRPDEMLAKVIAEDRKEDELRSLKTKHPKKGKKGEKNCAYYMNSFFAEGPSCFQIQAETFAVKDCVVFPTDFGGGAFTRFFNLTATPDGLVEGTWGTVLNYDPSLPGFASEHLVGVVDLHDCSFVFTETDEIATYTGRVYPDAIEYTQAQPGELYAVSKGKLQRQDFRI